MNKRVKATWVRALRSGKYEQGTGLLRRKNVENEVDQFCCLGVLCDVIVKSRSVHKPDIEVTTQKGGFREEVEYIYNNQKGSLADEILEYTGMSELTESKLIGMNDGGKSFTEIADWIEANL